VAKRERVNFLYDTKKTERELARERSAKICRIKGPFCHALTLQKQEIAFEEIRSTVCFGARVCAESKFLGTMLCFSSSTFELDRIFFDASHVYRVGRRKASSLILSQSLYSFSIFLSLSLSLFLSLYLSLLCLFFLLSHQNLRSVSSLTKG